MVLFSVLDLAPIVEGGDAAQALRQTIALAQHAERLGFQRYWLAEHHIRMISTRRFLARFSRVSLGTSGRYSA